MSVTRAQHERADGGEATPMSGRDEANRRRASTSPDPSAGNLTYGIVNSLGRAIVTRVYSNEHPLPYEAELCTQYRVSRPILREAVKMLSTKGLLASRPRRGTWVQDPSHWHLLDPDVLVWLGECEPDSTTLIELIQLRLAIAPAAAALAAKAARGVKHRSLLNAAEDVAAAARGETDGLRAEIAFHVAVLEASGNRFFAQLSQFTETAVGIRARRGGSFLAIGADAEQHRQLAHAIATGDVRQAKRLCEHLIDKELAWARTLAPADLLQRRIAPCPQVDPAALGPEAGQGRAGRSRRDGGAPRGGSI